MATRALVLGSTGLIGTELVSQLLDDPRYSEVVVLTRRKQNRSHPKFKEIIGDLDSIEEQGQWFEGADVFCCLGTTIKKAGSQEAFRKVDYDYPLRAARISRERGASKFLLITALGSDASSRVFYNRVKGELERDIQALGLKETHVFRPSILSGPRNEKRTGEKAGIFVAKIFEPLMVGPARRYRATPSTVLARAMVRAASDSAHPGFHFHENDMILREGS